MLTPAHVSTAHTRHSIRRARPSLLLGATICLFAGLLVATGCCGGRVMGDERSGATLGASWSPAWFPMNDGDVWVYQYTFERGGSKSEETRVKWARPSTRWPGLVDQIDTDKDSYAFSSCAELGWRLHTEYEVDDPSHYHRFEPPLTYLNAEVMEKGIRTEKHIVIEEDGKPSGTSIDSTAKVVGWEEIDVPALGGMVKALKTTFQYITWSEGKLGVTFDATNWLVEGVGNVRRTLALRNPDGKVSFVVTLNLLAARVGGGAYPKADPDRLAALVFRHAWERRERFRDPFEGFEAAFTCAVDGKSAGDAVVKVSKVGRPSVELGGVTEAERDAAMGVLMMQFGHRRPRSFEDSHAGHTFKLGTAQHGGIAIDVIGDAMGSRYEVLESSLKVVSRKTRDGGRQDVVVDDVAWRLKRYRPLKFHVNNYDADGKPSGRLEYTNEYTLVKGNWIPSAMTYWDGKHRREYRMTSHKE